MVDQPASSAVVEDGMDGAPPQSVSYGAMLRSFGTIGLTSFGGGRIAYFWHEFRRRKDLVSEHDLLDGIAVSQLLPGPNITNLAVYLGHRMRGLPGALLALTAVAAPGALIMLVLSILYIERGQTPALEPLFRGVGPGAAALALSSTLGVSLRTARDPAALALVALTFVAVALFRLNPLLVAVPVTLVGALVRGPAARRRLRPTPLQPSPEGEGRRG